MQNSITKAPFIPKTVIKLRILLFAALVALSTDFVEGEAFQGRDFYQEGMAAYESGDLGKALNIWVEAYNTIDQAAEIDPRIGSTFIEIIASYDLREFYDEATTMYYWALSSKGGGDLVTYLVDEIRKSEAVFDQYRFERLIAEAEGDIVTEGKPYNVAAIVKAKWISLDPTPETPANERLIEHWQRVTFARKNFTENDNTIFGTDDRTLSYLKYGPPSHIDKGHLALDEQFIRNEYTTASVALLPNPLGANLNEPEVDKIVLNDLMVQLSSSTYSPDFEVWVYQDLTTAGNMVKIFGEEAVTREFREVYSLADFLTSKTLGSQVEIGDKKVSAGYLVLMSYYNQLKMYDNIFAENYLELTSALSRSGFIASRLSVKANQSDVGYAMERIEQTAPVERSEYMMEIGTFEVEAEQYLFYNAENEPYFLSVMSSFPQKILLEKIAQTQREDINTFQVHHSLRTVSYGEEDVESVSHLPAVPFENVDMIHPAQSIFKVPLAEGDAIYNFSAQIYDTEADGYQNSSNILPANMKGAGYKSIEQLMRHAKPEGFEVSDIVLGYQFEEVPISDDVAFMVALDKKIPSFSNLWTHFQAVNLQANSLGTTHLEVELSVMRNGRPFGRDARSTISTTLNDNRPQIEQSLEYQLEGRAPGKYTFEIKLTDLVSGESRTKKVDFEIISIGQSHAATTDQ